MLEGVFPPLLMLAMSAPMMIAETTVAMLIRTAVRCIIMNEKNELS